MKKIYLKVYIQKIYSIDSNFEIVNESYKQYEMYIDLNEDFVSELYSTVMETKGDFINFDYNDSLNICYIDLGLIFQNNDLDENDKEALTKTTNAIENLISKKSLPNKEIDSQTYENAFNENGILISIKDLSEGYEIDKQLLLNYFINNNIKYKEVLHQGHSYDGGASGGNDSFIFYITSVILSGLTWDMIKNGMIEVLNCSQDLVKINYLVNFRFKKLRKLIEDRSKVKKEDLILTELKRNKSNDIIITFMSKNGIVIVRTNDSYQIKDYKYKPYSSEDFAK